MRGEKLEYRSAVKLARLDVIVLEKCPQQKRRGHFFIMDLSVSNWCIRNQTTGR